MIIIKECMLIYIVVIICLCRMNIVLLWLLLRVSFLDLCFDKDHTRKKIRTGLLMYTIKYEAMGHGSKPQKTTRKNTVFLKKTAKLLDPPEAVWETKNLTD